jgi:hypothetical protein
VTLRLRWHDDVPADLRSVRSGFGDEALVQARELITQFPGDPLLGEWLTQHPGTGDLSACRKVKFGPDEIADDGTSRGPALRLVYRLIPSNTDPRQVEILCVGPRRDLIAYAIAAARLSPPSP